MGARTEHRGAEEEGPKASLARLKAEWQAEALEAAADLLPNSHPVATDLSEQVHKLRRQAEGNNDTPVE